MRFALQDMESTASATPTDDFHVTVFEAIPSPIFVVDTDLSVIDFNAAAANLPDPIVFSALRPRAGDILRCVYATAAGCGNSPGCHECSIRNVMREALETGYVCRRAVRMSIRTERQALQDVDYLVTAAPFEDGRDRLMVLIMENLGEMMALRQRAWDELADIASPRAARAGKH